MQEKNLEGKEIIDIIYVLMGIYITFMGLCLPFLFFLFLDLKVDAFFTSAQWKLAFFGCVIISLISITIIFQRLVITFKRLNLPNQVGPNLQKAIILNVTGGIPATFSILLALTALLQEPDTNHSIAKGYIPLIAPLFTTLGLIGLWRAKKVVESKIKDIQEDETIPTRDDRRRIHPFHPAWLMLASSIGTFMVGGILAAVNFHLLNKPNKRNITIIVLISTLAFLGYIPFEEIVVKSYLNKLIFVLIHPFIGVCYTLFQLDDYKKWKANKA
jgi:hypothetical protein